MKLLGFVLGVRVNKSFSIEDKLGAIVDDILNHKNDTFSPDKFPRIRQSFDSRILLNESTGDILQLAPEGVVLEHYVEDSFDDELEVTLNAFEEIIIKGVLKKYKIRNINRIGFMVKSIVEANDEFLDDIIGVISKNYDKPKSLSVRFNTTKNVPQKIEKIVTQDYENLILTYDRPSEDKNFVFSADYQKHFIPPLNIIDDLKRTFDSSFDKFCKRAIKDFRSKYIDDGSQKRNPRSNDPPFFNNPNKALEQTKKQMDPQLSEPTKETFSPISTTNSLSQPSGETAETERSNRPTTEGRIDLINWLKKNWINVLFVPFILFLGKFAWDANSQLTGVETINNTQDDLLKESKADIKDIEDEIDGIKSDIKLDQYRLEVIEKKLENTKK